MQKFGGTSMQDADAMKRAAQIVASTSGSRLVVLSAASGITNLLLKVVQLAAEGGGEEASSILMTVHDRHCRICEELLSASALSATILQVKELCTRLSVYIHGISLLREYTAESSDTVVAYGELLSTLIFSNYLQSAGCTATLLDARTVLRTNSEFGNAKPIPDNTQEQCNTTLSFHGSSGDIIVTQGFIGSDVNGRTTTLGRGGSDYTAAILGAAVKADEIQIWTDVSGVYSADPNHVPEAHSIPHLTFEEARQLAYFGAKVLHPETILPAIQSDIPVRVLNSFQPEHPGTLITAQAPAGQIPHIRAVTVKFHCLLLTWETKLSGNISGGISTSTLVSILETAGLPVLLFAGGERYVSAVVDETSSSYTQAVLSTLQLTNVIITECCILSAVGPEVGVSKHSNLGCIAKFAEIAQRFDAFSVLTSVTGTSCLTAILPRVFADAALSAVHSLVNFESVHNPNI